jgi:hypothetical protein
MHRQRMVAARRLQHQNQNTDTNVSKSIVHRSRDVCRVRPSSASARTIVDTPEQICLDALLPAQVNVASGTYDTRASIVSSQQLLDQCVHLLGEMEQELETFLP